MSNLWVTANYGRGDKPTWLDEHGEHEIDTENHPMREVPIEKIEKGDLVRPGWNKTMPFERADGPSLHDDGYPSHYLYDPDTRMFTANYKFKFGPHYPEGTPFHVYRGHP